MTIDRSANEAVFAASFAIVARAANGVIGDGPHIPWRSSADFAHFKAATMGNALIIGRTTFDSIPSPLKGRTIIVVTSRPLSSDHATAAASVDEAVQIALASGAPAIAFAGGLGIYAAALALPWMRKILLTEIDAEPTGEIRLPPFGPEWHEKSRITLDRREGEPLATVVDLRR